jgi:hypothetical protein
VPRGAKQRPEKYPWLTQLLARRPFKVVAIALAQLDGPHRLGVVGQWRALPGTTAYGGVRKGLAKEG